MRKKINPEILTEIEKIKEHVQKVDEKKMVYKGYKNTYDVTKFETIQSFGEAIETVIITMDISNHEQN